MTSRHYTASATPDPSNRYASDLDDQEFERSAPLVAQKEGSGKKRTVDIREILNAIFYRVRTGCQWRMGSSGLAGEQITVYRIRKTWRVLPVFRPS